MSEDPKSIPPSRHTLEHAKVGDDHIQYIHDQLQREKSEPSEGFTPVPIFLLFVFSALIFWGGIYVEKNSGEFRWDAYDPQFSTKGMAVVEPPDYDSVDWLMPRGERIYAQCVACHQADGNGMAGAFPPLAGSNWVTGSEELLAGILINGLVGEIEVMGNSYNGNMPAFGPNGTGLRPRDIAAVLTYIRSSWGNAADPITATEMESYMALAPMQRSGPWSGPELFEAFGPVE
ncbi:MAG: cytochrome c [Opitutales bacterium]|nr:cytochrome c [Opitutales bacterium]NRA26641.1 cytochrome c [Opitutales bacterium]